MPSLTAIATGTLVHTTGDPRHSIDDYRSIPAVVDEPPLTSATAALQWLPSMEL